MKADNIGRGMLTERVKEIAAPTFGGDFSTRELRLLPYLVHCAQNEGRIDPNKINSEEREILKAWKARGYIEGGATGLYMTRQFWDAANAVIWEAYVVQQGGDLPQ